MTNNKPKRPALRKPLENGQVWRVGKANLRIQMMGKLLVHYKLGLPKAVRVPTSITGITTLEKYMKKNKASLIEG